MVDAVVLETSKVAGGGGRTGGGGERKKKKVSKSVKACLQFPVARVARYLKKGRYAKRIGIGAPIYLAAVLEYLAAEVIINNSHLIHHSPRLFMLTNNGFYELHIITI